LQIDFGRGAVYSMLALEQAGASAFWMRANVRQLLA